jgi:probable F420-dependent oxidoreductase
MFGYLAAATDLELVTGIIIAPQRPTALIAKQAAEVDLLTGGRFRLGVGIGWNPVEYDALGQDFSRRGRRLDEQVPLLRRLWTERSVTFGGEREKIEGAGLAPLPIQQPIPIWFGGASEPAYRRIGRLADGWFPMLYPGERLDAALATIRGAAEAEGRDASNVPMEGRVRWLGDDEADEFRKHVDRWREAGATHLSVDTMRCGLDSAEAHVDALGRAWDLMQG